MVINHVDNRSLYYHTINRESNKLLIDKMHECFHLLQQIQDKDISGKLYLAVSDAVDMPKTTLLMLAQLCRQQSARTN